MLNPHVRSVTPPLRQIRTLVIVVAVIFAFALLAFGFSGASAANWSNPKRIPGTNLAQNDIATALAPGGGQWVVWEDSPSGTYYQIWYSSRNANGDWASAGVMSKGAGSTYKPDIAVGPDYTKLSTWEELSGNLHRIFFVQFTNSPGNHSRLTKSNSAEYQPATAFGPDGSRHIVYSAGGTIMHAQSSDGKSWSIDRVSPSGDLYYNPTIAIDSSNNTINVAYGSLVAAEESPTIYYTQRALSGGKWKGAMKLGGGQNANIAARNGNVAVSWTDSTSAHYPSVRVAKNGSWSGAQRPSQFSGGFRTHVVLDSSGNAHMTWMQNIDGHNYDIYYSDSTNGKWASAKPVKSSPGFNEGNDLVIDSADGLHVVYLQYDGSSKNAYSADRAGSGTVATNTPNNGPSATNTPLQPGTVLYNDDDPAVQYSGGWLYVNDDTHPVHNDYHTTNKSGKTATLSFFGTSVRFTYIRSTNYGKADVYIDNSKVDTIDMYAGTLTYKVSRTYSGLSAANHTIKIVNTGNKNASSGNTYIVVDAFYVTVPAITNTPTRTLTPSNTPTQTYTPTDTNTPDPSESPTATFTATNTRTPTNTPTITATNAPTATPGNKQYFDDKSKKVTYKGKWSVGSDLGCLYKGTYHFAEPNAKNTLSLTFSGRQIKYWYVSGSSYGRVQIFIDGQLQGGISLQGSTGCALWKSPVLAPGQHTLELKPKGTSGRINMDVIVAIP